MYKIHRFPKTDKNLMQVCLKQNKLSTYQSTIQYDKYYLYEAHFSANCIFQGTKRGLETTVEYDKNAGTSTISENQ